MRPPCEEIVKRMLPAFRAMVARELVKKYHYSQVQAATKLGTTQAAISQYLYSKRGGRIAGGLTTSPELEREAERIADGIVRGRITSDAVNNELCSLCRAARMKA
ncbi:MAG: transcriptional regulator [Candidatus Bathyarchaeia archaeon]